MFVKENPDKKKPCSFKLLIRSAERLRRTENSVQEIEIICKMLNRKILKPFQSYLSNGSNKTNLVNYIFQWWKEILQEHL